MRAGVLHALPIRERGFVHQVDLVCHHDGAASRLIAKRAGLIINSKALVKVQP